MAALVKSHNKSRLIGCPPQGSEGLAGLPGTFNPLAAQTPRQPRWKLSPGLKVRSPASYWNENHTTRLNRHNAQQFVVARVDFRATPGAYILDAEPLHTETGSDGSVDHGAA